MSSIQLLGVYFFPWVGAGFRDQEMRLLLLGESHHSTEAIESQTMTIDCTQAYVDRKWTHRYWTEIMKVVEGRDYWEIDRGEFWSKVAFYNYIQEIVGDSPGIAPTAKMQASSEQGLKSVLSYLQPTHVLVLAKRLWDSLPKDIWESHRDITFDGKSRNSRLFTCGGDHNALSTWLPHPSYPFHFNAKRYHPGVREFLTLTAPNKARQ